MNRIKRYYYKDKFGITHERQKCCVPDCCNFRTLSRNPNGSYHERRTCSNHNPDGSIKTGQSQREKDNRRWRSCGILFNRDQYDALFNLQKGKCALCGKPYGSQKRQLNLDHNHSTGAIRGILCSRCNAALGWFELHVPLDKLMSYVSQDVIEIHPELQDIVGKKRRLA